MYNDKENWDKVKNVYMKEDNITLGKYFSYGINEDIKHLLFALSRYKFASKMLENKSEIELLELGCNEGIGTYFFQQNGVCKNIVGVDLDTDAIKWAKDNIAIHNCENKINVSFIEDNFINKKYGDFDAIVSLDVIEHIDKKYESDFINTLDINLKKEGIAIIGTPNKLMDSYASEASKVGHINLYNQKTLYNLLSQKFHNVFIFGMNDEVVHTGFYPMSCYIMALCCNKK